MFDLTQDAVTAVPALAERVIEAANPNTLRVYVDNVLRMYAHNIVAGTDDDLHDAARWMFDHAEQVARETSLTAEQVRAWCNPDRKQENMSF